MMIATLHLLLQRQCPPSEAAIARVLKPYNIRITHKPIMTLRRLLTNVEDKDESSDRQGAVYIIACY